VRTDGVRATNGDDMWAPQHRDERGATAVEYAVIVAGIAAVIIAAVAVLGLAVFDCFNAVNGVF
jgi:Flp pilus assembly pilin Flp